MNINNYGSEEQKKQSVPVLFEKKENCCGCAACYSVCPAKAIVMEFDNEGFLYPEINEEKCIHCYKCQSVCAFKIDQKQKGYI